MSGSSCGRDRPRVAFVSTAVSPYSVSARVHIDDDGRIRSRHVFARRVEPGRQWPIGDLPASFEVARGFALRFGRRFVYLPLGLPLSLWRFRPDVIVSEQLGTLLLFTLLYAVPARIPVLLRWEGTAHTESRYSLGLRRLVRCVLASRVSGFLCYSSGAESYLRTLGQTQPARRIPYSADDTLFHPPIPLDRRSPHVFLFVGQLIERKGIQWLLPAFYVLRAKYPYAELWVVGDGPLRGELERNVPQAHRSHVRWLGFLHPDAIAQHMRAAGCLVCPTLEDHGPVVQIEAAKTGLPIISTPYSGNAELVVDPGVNGDIVEPADREALVRAMAALLDHPNRLAAYAKSLELAARHSAAEEGRVTIDAILSLSETASRPRNCLPE